MKLEDYKKAQPIVAEIRVVGETLLRMQSNHTPTITIKWQSRHDVIELKEVVSDLAYKSMRVALEKHRNDLEKKLEAI